MHNMPRLVASCRTLAGLIAAMYAQRRHSRLALQNWGIVLAGLTVVQGVNAVTSIVVARAVSPVEFGQYLTSLGLASLLVVLPSFGMDTWLLAKGWLPAAQLAVLWHSLLKLRIILLGVWLICMALLALVLPREAYPILVLWPTALALALESMVLLAHSALRSVGRHLWVTGLQMAATVTLLVTTIGLRLRPGQIALYTLTRALIWALVMPITLKFTWRLLASSSPRVMEVLPASSSTAFMVSDLAAAIYTRAPLTIVALLLGADSAAVFGPAANLILFAYLVPNALYLVVLPLLARIWRERPAHYRRYALAQIIVQGLAGSAISLATLLLGETVLVRLLGANYAPSVPSLLWLSPIPFLKSVNFGLAAVLTAAERQEYRTVAQVICAAFIVGGSLILARPLDLAGMAMVLVVGESLLLLGYALGAVWSRRSLPAAAAATS